MNPQLVVSGRISGGVWIVKAVPLMPNGQRPKYYRWSTIRYGA